MDEYKCDPDIVYLLDVFGGGDTIAFVHFHYFMDEMIIRANNGDKGAEGLVLILRRFAKLVRTVDADERTRR